MSTPTTTTTAASERVAAAEVALQEATTAHQKAREASDASRAILASLEAAADRGDDVDTATYTTAKADLGLKSRRTAALAAKVATAQTELDGARRAALVAETRAKAETLPDVAKARATAEKALGKILDALEARDARMADLKAEFRRVFGTTTDRGPGADGIPVRRTLGGDDYPAFGGGIIVDGVRHQDIDVTRELEAVASPALKAAATRR